jgi:hypothetical protein
MDIFDIDRKKWYEVKRGWFGRLKLREIIYEGIIRLPVDGDLVYSTKLSLRSSKIPPTPDRKKEVIEK